MPRKAVSLADRLRRHRAAFELALELGITPAEAETELTRRDAQAKAQAAAQRLNTRMTSPLRPETAPDPPVQPWWNRD
jgi:hypothetical protein